MPVITYTAVEGNGNDIELKLSIDGKSPYTQLENFLVYRVWKNVTDEFSSDSDGDEFSPEQEESFVSKTTEIYDSDGFVTEPLCVALTAGEHYISLSIGGEPIRIERLVFDTPQTLIKYDEYAEKYKNAAEYKGKEIVLEGEKAIEKSQKSFVPMASRNDAAQDQANWEKEYKVTTGDMDGNGILSKTEIEKLKKINSSGSGKTTEEKPRTGFKFDSTEKANIRNIYNEAYDEAIKAGASVDDANMQAATVLENYLAENSFSNLNSAEEDIIAQIIGSDAKYYKLDGKHYTEDELWEAIKKKYPKATQTGLSMLHKAIISGEISDVSAEFIEELFNKK